MNNWFNVSGQDCPIAIESIRCETNLDCSKYIQNKTSCKNLNTTGTGLGWVSNKAIRSSRAGNLTCNPIRGVCEMYTNEEKPQVMNYFTSIYIVLLLIICLFSFIFSQFDLLLGMSVFSIPILITGFYVVWIRKCCRMKCISKFQYVMLDVLCHWIPVIVLLFFIFFKNPKIKSKKIFWVGYFLTTIVGIVYTIIKYNSLENIYNSKPIPLISIFLCSLFISTFVMYKHIKN